MMALSPPLNSASPRRVWRGDHIRSSPLYVIALVAATVVIRLKFGISKRTSVLLSILLAAAPTAWRRWFSGRRNAAPLMRALDPLLVGKSATQLAKLIRQGDVRCLDLVSVSIEHLRRTQATLNGLAGDDDSMLAQFERAKADAAHADELVARARSSGRLSDLPPYLGVPICVKECFEVPGQPFTAGLVARRHCVGKKWATALERANSRLGCIVVGVTNTSEACMWFEAYNYNHGVSSNPYDTSRTPGGSSGGAGATVASCAVPWAITSDVGGSTRIPALYNCCFGHKPTGGSIPNTGTIPATGGGDSLIERYCQLGPFSRHSEDLWPLLSAMAGPETETETETAAQTAAQTAATKGGGNKGGRVGSGGDRSSCLPLPACSPFSIQRWDSLRPTDTPFDPSQSFDLQGLKVINCSTACGGSKLISRRDGDSVAAQQRVVAWLRERGANVLDGPEQHGWDTDSDLKDSFDIWGACMSEAQLAPFREVISEGKSRVWVLWEIAKWAVGRSDHTLPALGLSLVERLFEATPGRRAALAQRGEALRIRLEAALGDNGVLLYPSLPVCAPRHNDNLFRIFDAGVCGIWNALQLPATAVPLGLNHKHLPMGMQIVSARGQDHLTVGLAMKLEHMGAPGCRWCHPKEL